MWNPWWTIKVGAEVMIGNVTAMVTEMAMARDAGMHGRRMPYNVPAGTSMINAVTITIVTPHLSA